MPRLYTSLVPGGDELVVFLHAVGGDHSSWRPQVEALRGVHSTLTFDMRGHGRSFSPDRPEISIARFAEDALNLVKEAGYARAHFVGLSMGAVVAQEIFARAPERVQSLALAATWCFHPEAAGRRAWMQDKLSRMSMMASAAMDMPNLYAPDAPRELVDAAIAVEGAKDKDVFLQSWHSMFQVDYRELLPRVDVPVLLIGGTEDKITPIDPLLLEIHRLTPMAELVVLAGGGHFCNLDRADAFNAALLPFLRRARARAPQVLALPPNPPAAEPPADTVAGALLTQLARRGVPCLFSNSGTDFTPLIEALARPGREAPRVVAAAHENTAIAMAHGYFALSGHVPAVMAHVNVGTANSGLGLINARRARVPLLVMAGLTPYTDSPATPGHRTNFVQWGQDTFDQAAYFREFTKWDYRLATPEHLEVAVDRALAIAASDPAGPVYLTLPKEVLCAPASTAPGHALPRQRPTPPARPDAVALARVARAVRAARRPLLLTAELGRYRGGPEALWQLATRHGIGVVEFGKRNFFNLSTECPMHLGFDPGPYLRDCDLILAVEDPVPFIPAFTTLPSGQIPPIVQIGVDPLLSDLPLRGFASDLALPGDPAESLRLLTGLLDADPGDLRERRSALQAEHARVFAAAAAAAAADANLPAISKRWLSRCLGRVVDDSVVIFNEYPLDPVLVPRRLPDSWFENSIASGLGWALGAALGGKLARPDRTIVAAVGDGSFLFNTPLSALHTAAAHRLPIVMLVFNDRAWSTIRRSTRGDFPAGHAASAGDFALCDFAADPAYDRIAEACGGVGLRVERPDEVEATLRRALELVRTGDRFVLVDARCDRDG